MKKYFRTYFLFVISALVCFIISLFPLNESLDISTHDTYLVVNYSNILQIFGIYFLLSGLIYYLFNKFKRKTIRILVDLHFWIIIICVFSFFVCTFFVTSAKSSKSYYSSSFYSEFDAEQSNSLTDFNYLISLVAVLFLLAQLIFIANILVALFKSKKPL